MLKPKFAAGMAVLLMVPGVRASFDPSAFDKSVSPKDDFFRYANGAWLKNTPIPPDY